MERGLLGFKGNQGPDLTRWALTLDSNPLQRVRPSGVGRRERNRRRIKVDYPVHLHPFFSHLYVVEGRYKSKFGLNRPKRFLIRTGVKRTGQTPWCSFPVVREVPDPLDPWVGSQEMWSKDYPR